METDQNQWEKSHANLKVGKYTNKIIENDFLCEEQ